MILCLETSTNLCSVALTDSAGVISLKENDESKSHASVLTIFIEELLKEAGVKIKDLEAIAVSKGPGSYTGLRIGVSVAKGIAYASSVPLIGIDTTYSMFWGIVSHLRESAADYGKTLFCPMLDARRMEVYYSIYDYSGNTVRKIKAEVIREDSFNDIDASVKIIFFGDGAVKCREVIRRENVHFDDDFRISASHMFRPANIALKNRDFEDVAYFEPFYLKDFVTTKPGKNVLGN